MIETFLLCLVTSVVDGDTLRVQCGGVEPEQFSVRLHAIDAPEKGQEHWRESRDALQTLTLNRRVDLECFYKSGKRRVCTVGVVGDGQTTNSIVTEPGNYDAALVMIVEGWAVHHQKYKREQPARERKLYETAEQAAREHGRGMWEKKR